MIAESPAFRRGEFVNFVNTEPGTQINLISDKDSTYTLGDGGITAGAPKTFYIPSLVAGTSGADVLSNDREAYTINAEKGNDTISNTGASVTINAGAGNDTVNVTAGESVMVYAEDGNDTVEIASSAHNAYVDGGAGKDVIIVKDDVTGVSVEGGAGDDLIIGNNTENVYFYNKGDGKDSIYGYTSGDKIVLGAGLAISLAESSNGAGDSQAVKTEVTDNGLVFTIWDSESRKEAGKLTLKGQRSGGTEGSTTASDYGAVAGGISFVFVINDSEVTYEIPLTIVVSATSNNVLTENAP